MVHYEKCSIWKGPIWNIIGKHENKNLTSLDELIQQVMTCKHTSYTSKLFSVLDKYFFDLC